MPFSDSSSYPIKPSDKEIDKYLTIYNSSKDYKLTESSLKKLFTQTYPLNVEVTDVLIKVCSLDSIFHTNLNENQGIVAKHIVSLEIDKRLKINDIGLVNEIAKIKANGKVKNFYSFATKYCSNHKPLDYPIYDSKADSMLQHFQKVDNFYKSGFQPDDLKNYPVYRNILLEFQKFYNLDKYNLREIDKYLWLAGKEYFPRPKRKKLRK